MIEPIDLAQLTSQVCLLAKEIGSFVLHERMSFDTTTGVETKSPRNFVTKVDKAAEIKIIKHLSTLLPGAAFLAEEGTVALSDEAYCWVIDPIDGTTNFIQNLSPYCISIALRNRQEMLLGVVFEVTRSECFYAWKGGGAYLDNKMIHVSSYSQIEQSVILSAIPYDLTNYKDLLIRMHENLIGRAKSLRLFGSAAAELCYVACGRAEARIESFLSPWDVAAGGLILHEAGGLMTDFSGYDTAWSGREVLATNGSLHPQLCSLLQQLSE